MTNKRIAPKAKSTVTVLNGGAHRGAERNLDALLDWNQLSSRHALVPRYVDPVPGRAAALADRARERGLAAESIEGRIEEEVRELPEGTEPLILNLDRADTIAEVLRTTEGTARTTLGYLLVKLPTTELWALRFAIAPRDTEARSMARRLFTAIANITAPRGSSFVVGERAESAHVAAEPRFRAWMAAHTKENLGRVVAGLPPDGWPLEATTDGSTSRPMVVVEGNAWRDPAVLARELVAAPPVPLIRGEDFVIAEITPEGVRLHTVRLRLTDGDIRVTGLLAVTRDVLPSPVPESRSLSDAASVRATAIERSERTTATRLNPLYTTD